MYLGFIEKYNDSLFLKRDNFASLRKNLLALMTFCALLSINGCANTYNKIILKISSVEDIPDITKKFEPQLKLLKVGMTKGQVLALFPGMERECFESGVCYFTVFDEKFVQIDHRVSDLNLLTTSLVTLIGLTCILSSDDCNQALVAALNLMVASSIKNHEIQYSSSGERILTLLQWINIEFVNDKVTQWAINEPLPQFQPKSFNNELPSLEDALNL